MLLRTLFLLLALCLTAPLTQAQEAPRTLVHCGTLLDPAQSMEPMPERTIIVENGRVAGIEEGFAEAGAEDRVVDLRQRYCLPGLIDSHTHLTSETRPNAYIDRFRLTAADRALMATTYGRCR